MATPVFCCGFECRLAALGHWDDWVAGGGTMTAQNTYARNSGYALRIQATADSPYVRYLTGAVSVVVARVYLYLVSLPAADVDCIVELLTGVPTSYTLGFTQSTSRLNFGVAAGSKTAGPVVSSGTWYRLDIRGNLSANPHVFDWQIDGVAQTQVTNASAATTWYAVYMGSRATAATFDACYDDVVLSNTTGDYPWGAGLIKAYVPTSDGTHNVT